MLHFKRIVFFLGLIVATSCKDNSENLQQAQTLAENDNCKEALVIWNDIIEGDPKNLDALLGRAYCFGVAGKDNYVIRDCSTILCCVDSVNVLALYNRALSYSQIGKRPEAIRDLNNAIQLKGGEVVWSVNSNNPYDVAITDLRFERGLVHYKMSNYESAFSDMMFCTENNFLPGESYYYRGLIYKAYNNKDKACTDFQTAAGNGNTNADSLVKNFCLE